MFFERRHVGIGPRQHRLDEIRHPAPEHSAAASAATSSLHAAPAAMPAATGFIPTARRPCAAQLRNSAHATTVLPTPVSVPVMNSPRVISLCESFPCLTSRANVALEAHDRTPVGGETRLGLPRVAIDDFVGCG